VSEIFFLQPGVTIFNIFVVDKLERFFTDKYFSVKIKTLVLGLRSYFRIHQPGLSITTQGVIFKETVFLRHCIDQ